jgi:hypothetical protein
LKLIVGAGQNGVVLELECRWEDGVTLVVRGGGGGGGGVGGGGLGEVTQDHVR